MPLVSVFARPTRPQDILELAKAMREDDRRECLATMLTNPITSVAWAVDCSDRCITGFIRGEMAFIGGVSPPTFYSDARQIWLLGTDVIEREPMAFLRFCRKRMKRLRAEYPAMYNRVDARNEKTIRWLRWLGFAIHGSEPYGPLNRPFHHFAIGMDDVLAGSGSGGGDTRDGG